MDPANALATAAKTGVRAAVDWAYGPNTWKRNRRNGNGKEDPIFAQVPMDTLRRAAYHSVFSTLFDSPDTFPYVVPDKTLKDVVDKLNNLIFPTDTVFKPNNEALEDLLSDLLEQTRFQLKAEEIIEEAAVLGYCGIRSVWDEDAEKWLYEIKEKEYLVIETPEGKPEQIDAIGMEWPIVRVEKGKEVRYWRKERWTLDTYELWAAKPEKLNGEKPDFKPEDLELSTPNNYGELPITLVPHYYDSNCHGHGLIGPEEVLSAKALIRLRHKRHFAHLKYMDPNIVRVNHVSPGEPIDMGIGTVIDLQQIDEKGPTDLKLLEFAGIPDSAKDEFYDHVKAIYQAGGLKAPPPEDVFKVNNQQSGVALRLIDTDDAKTVQTLRDNGYSQVIRHFEKILRMGANLRLPDYAGINVEDKDSYGVTAKFPDFFPPTEDEKALMISNFKAAMLPTRIIAQKIAAMYGLEDPADLAEIERNLENEKAMLEPTTNIPPGG